MCDLSLPTRNRTRAPCMGRQILDHQGSPYLCKFLKTGFQTDLFSFYLVGSINDQFSSVQSLSRVWLFVTRSTPGLPVYHQLLEFTQTHVHWVGDAIQLSHLPSSPSPPAPNPSQHQGVVQWVNSSHEVAKVLEFQLQHQSFQCTPKTDLL